MSQSSTTVGPIDAAIRGQSDLPADLPIAPLPAVSQGRTPSQPDPEADDGRGFFGAFGDAWDANALHRATTRMLERAGTFHERDPDFQFNDDTWKMVSAGVPREDWDEFDNAVSFDHAVAIRNQLLEKKYRNERLAQDGLSGVAAQIVAGMVDPNALIIDGLATAATIPLAGAGGYAGRVNRLRQALEAGDDAVQLVRQTRRAMAIESGLSASAASMAIESILAADNESSARNVALAGLLSFGVGGGLSRLGTRGLERDVRAATEIARNIDESQLLAIADNVNQNDQFFTGGAAMQHGAMSMELANEWQRALRDPKTRKSLGLEPLPASSKTPTFFHGTPSEFSQFDADRSGGLIFFTEDEARAQAYGSGLGGNREVHQPGQQLYIDDDGYAYERRGDMAVPVAQTTRDGDALEPIPAGVTVEPLRVQEVEMLVAQNIGDMVNTNARVLGVNLNAKKTLDIRPNAGGHQVLAGLDDMGNQYARRVIDDAALGEFNWRRTRTTTVTQEWQSVIVPQLREMGYDSIRFLDDSHPTTAVFSPEQVEILTEKRPYQLGSETVRYPDADTTPDIAADMAKIPRDIKVAQAVRARNHIVEVARAETEDLDEINRMLNATDDELLEIIEGHKDYADKIIEASQPRSMYRFRANVSLSNARLENVRAGGAATMSRLSKRSPHARTFATGLMGDTMARENGDIIGLGVHDQYLALQRGNHQRLEHAYKRMRDGARKEGIHNISADMIENWEMQATNWLRKGRPDSGADAVPRYIQEYAEEVMAIRDDSLMLAKDHMVPGSDRFTPDPDYIPQRPSAQAMDQFIKSFEGDGKAAVEQAISEAWRRANTEIIDGWKAKNLSDAKIEQIIKSIGPKYLRRLHDSRYDTTPYATFDFDRMADILRSSLEEEIGADRVTDLLRSIRPTGESADIVPSFRSRTALDLDVIIPGTDRSLASLYENNMSVLMMGYARDMGRASMKQEIFDAINRQFGYEGDDAITNSAKLRSLIEQDLRASDLTDKKADQILKEIDQLINAMEGKPLLKQGRAARALRILKNIATATFGGSFGLAQQVESGTAAATVTVQRFLAASPAATAAMRKALNGEPPDQQVLKMMQYTGHGVIDAIMHGSLRYGRALQIDDYADVMAGTSTRLDRFERGTQKAARLALKAGGHEITETFQRHATSGAAYDWIVTEALSARGIRDSHLIRLGMSRQKADRLTAALKQWRDLGYLKKDGLVMDLDVGAAFQNNYQAFYDLRDAIGFLQTNLVQRQRLASSIPVLARDPYLNTMAQFRGFAIGAYEQQFLLNLSARDAKTFATAGYTLAVAYYITLVQEHARLYAQGATREEREEALDHERLSRIAFRRAGWASLFPDAADSIWQLTGGDPFFTDQARFSGLGNNLFSLKNYAVAGMVDGWGRAAMAVGNSIRNGNVAQEDVRAVSRVLPLQNNPLLRTVADKFAGQFETREELGRYEDSNRSLVP